MSKHNQGETLIFDCSDPPAPGTACVWCKHIEADAEIPMSHFCPAKGYVGETAVCRECGEGKPCERALAVKKATTRLDGSALVPGTSTPYERRCSDCKGLLSEQTSAAMCFPCKKRALEVDKRAAAKVEKAANLALGKVAQ